MRKNQAAFLPLILALAVIPKLAIANSGDFSNAVAIGTGYAGVSTAPANSLIVQGSVGIGSAAPISSLDLSQKNDGVALPVGTNGTRPTGAALTNGEIRYNSATPAIEAYIGGNWTTLQGGGTSGGTLGVANGGTGTSTSFTPGSVVFAGTSGIYAQDNAQFFWDDTNHRLGISTAAPAVSLDLSQTKDALALPVGSSGDRPATAANGEMRYNTSTPGIEAYVAGGWITLQTSGSSALPSGSIIMWATSSAPTGFLECDGSAVSRTTYAALFAAIGTTFGAGDGSTTFNLPDMRGYFPRGWADTGSVDSGRSLGSTQQDAFKSHTHTINDPGHSHSTLGLEASESSGIASSDMGSVFTTTNTGTSTTGITINSTGGTETRPVNVALMFCIKI